ncbi:RabGAP-TBC domain-containing protein [Cephalotus follicularis]|uniref:RabGAP-TBC domain-containing protein n=1 Tax=Cephalotus follicularis TaxID=3775 RepID=A0A1Q3CMI7_CEPFO|nr:RabGAP-TBC domain-containing protein [Cephalotus follicularis]
MEETVGETCLGNLRSVKWRIHLGILPSSSIHDLRRVTADSRRRYASLRRRLLIDPHLTKDGSNSPALVMDNPLSQNPDSSWGRFFRNAELEKMVDQDLSRLYPEHGSFFQTPGCQGMLRRILLLWCLRHPEFGYRQGMHELLAPLLYVLHVDVEHLSEVQKLYEDYFTDKFDVLSFHENDITYNFDINKFLDSMEDEMGFNGNAMKVRSLDELDPEIRTILLLSDAYGAEGELGIVLSEKFMEHDAYCMFDALMSGAHGSVAMADFFAPSPAGGLHISLSPVIEASAALYHLLSVVDSSLHSHLIELGVEPQYFALRWLRVLFGREFSLNDLLLLWDVIFAADNSKVDKGAEDNAACSFRILSSPRGSLISAIAVSMMLYLRSSLLATENATSCLQRLLNFPENIKLKNIIEKAKSLQALAMDANIYSSPTSFNGAHTRSKSMVVSGHNLSSDSLSPKTPLRVVPDTYWEEKWRVLHKAEELRQGSLGKENPTQKKGWSEKVRLTLSRTASDPSHGKVKRDKKEPKSSVRRSLLDDLSQQLGLEEDIEKAGSHEVTVRKDHPSVEVEEEAQDGVNNDFTCTADVGCSSRNAGSEENSSIFSDPASSGSGANDQENETEKSSVASNVSIDENDDHSQTNLEDPTLPVSHPPGIVSQNSQSNNDSTGNSVTVLKERKLLLGKFQWLWKFGRNAAGEGTSEKGGSGALESSKSANGDSNQFNTSSPYNTDHISRISSASSKGDTVDQNVMGTLKNLGNSMLEHIQVIESVFQQDRGQVGSLDSLSKNGLVGKGQVTAMTALKELRKISNLLSEM